MKIVISLLIFLTCSIGLQADDPAIPHWVTSHDVIEKSDISSDDYPYLQNWIALHSLPVNDYFYSLFDEHQIVIVGEQHNIKEHKTFLIDRIDSLYHRCGVRAMAWEFSKYSDNDRLQELITAPEFDSVAVLDFARSQSAHAWNSKDHWDIIRSVHALNQSLNNDQPKMTLIGLDIDEDISEVILSLYTKPDSSKAFQDALQIVQNRDRIMAQHLSEEIMEKNIKGLVFVGRCHDYTRHTLRGNDPMSKYIMGNELYKEYGDRIFQVWLYSGWFDIIEKILPASHNEMIGFNIDGSPFANVLQHTGWRSDPQAPFSEIAQGFIYIVPAESLHTNSTIHGFVTDAMFERYHASYKLNFGDTLHTASELDAYLQEHRW